MFSAFKKTDSQIQEDVTHELSWDPSLTSDKIAVFVRDGIITLRGSVPHYSEKTLAEKATQRVGGVRAVADELEVKLLGSHRRNDADIAQSALIALKWHYQVPEGVEVTVDRAWITLRGEVEWAYERNAAKNAVSSLIGVRGVTNEITLMSRIQPTDVKTRIEDALRRSTEGEGREIKVAVDDTKVTLTGNVYSFAEIEDARFAAWCIPGVMTVDDDNLKLVA
jgi:osmotically-inducible protein OsmY